MFASIRNVMSKQDKVLILGATGWFGQTMHRLLARNDIATLLIGSKARIFPTAYGTQNIHLWDFDEIASFKPTIVCDFAFLTREFASQMPISSYKNQNFQLLEQGLKAFNLPSVRLGMATSSGAVYFPSATLVRALGEDPYSQLKRVTEDRYRDLASNRNKALCILRPYSVSGDLVSKPRGFAFSDFISQALEHQQIKISSPHRIVRRYVSVDDLLVVGFLHASAFPDQPILESGGEKVDLLELAELIKSEINMRIKIEHRIDVNLPSDDYFAKGDSWERTCDCA
jgi:nucleoside-diphosphate-sugar epimerase